MAVVDVVKRLGEIEARANAATDGPWRRYETVQADTFVLGPRGLLFDDVVSGPTYARSNAEFIAHARTDVPALVAALRAVLEVADVADELASLDPDQECGLVHAHHLRSVIARRLRGAS